MDIGTVVAILVEGLNLQSDQGLRADTPLLGSIPELDSMGVVAVLTLVEERFGVVIEDDEITASIFNTVGDLAAFIEGKLPG